jgi:STE24 endopeptidase
MMTLPQNAPDPTRQQKAREYSKLSRRLLFLELGIGAILLLVLLCAGVSTRLVAFLPFSSPWSAALYFLILVLGYGIIVAPLGYYQDFVLPHRYGLSTQNVIGWLKDKAKSLSLGLLLGLCLVTVIYWLMERLPSLWWLAVGLIMFLLTLFLTWLAPTLLISLFFKLEPLKGGELKERLANLARRAKVDVKDVFSMNLSSKATTANAMLSGWGKSRRVIISDTLLQSYSFDEIEVTLAHELGHHIHHDIPKLMLIQTIAFLLAFYLTSLALMAGVVLFSFQGINDVAGFPWLVLVVAVCMLILQPILNWYNRRIELAADEAALKLSNNPQAFIGLMTKLTDQNLIEAEPGKGARILFYSHPSYGERVKLAHKSIQQSAPS